MGEGAMSRNKREGYYSGKSKGKYYRTKEKAFALDTECFIITLDECA